MVDTFCDLKSNLTCVLSSQTEQKDRLKWRDSIGTDGIEERGWGPASKTKIRGRPKYAVNKSRRKLPGLEIAVNRSIHWGKNKIFRNEEANRRAKRAKAEHFCMNPHNFHWYLLFFHFPFNHWLIKTHSSKYKSTNWMKFKKSNKMITLVINWSKDCIKQVFKWGWEWCGRLAFVGISMKGKSWFAWDALVSDNVEKVWALDALGSGPEWLVCGTEDSDFVLLFVFFPVISCWVVIHDESWSVEWHVGDVWLSLDAFVKSSVENTVFRAWLAFFGQQVEVWLIGGTSDTVVVLNKWSGRWTFNVTSVHVGL